MGADASKHKLAYVVETTRGTTPTNPRFTALPDTRTTLNLTRDTLTSERITGDRFPAKPRKGAQGIGGDLPVDLSASCYDDFISSALQGAWVEVGTADTVDLEIDDVANNGAVEGDTFATTNGVVTVERLDSKGAEMVLRYDPTTPAAATSYEISGTGDAKATIDGEVFDVIAYTDGANDATAKAGDTRLSFSVIREFSDFGAERFGLYKGCEVATWNLSAASNNIAKSTFTLWGREFVGLSNDMPALASRAPAINTQPYDTFSGQMNVDGVESCAVTDYNFSINNGHAPSYVVGKQNSEDASVTQAIVEGTVTVFFEDATLYNKFVGEQSFSLTLTLEDLDANQLVISLPNLEISSAPLDVTADGPISVPIAFTAHKDDTAGTHISVQRLFPLAV